MTRRALLAMLAIALLAATPPLASAAKRSWAQREIKLVTSRGLMTAAGGAFRPDDALTQGELAQLVTGLTGEQTRVPASPAGTCHDRAARRAARRRARPRRRGDALLPRRPRGRNQAARALRPRGRRPPARPALQPPRGRGRPRADVVGSGHSRRGRLFGRPDPALPRLGDRVDRGGGRASSCCPSSPNWQQRVLTYAFGLVGYPYVWGGTSTTRQAPFGVDAPGGFDCSGFLWQVYKLRALPGRRGPRRRDPRPHRRADGRRGRTRAGASASPSSSPATCSSSAPAARARRRRRSTTPGSTSAAGWMVHSSRYGVDAREARRLVPRALRLGPAPAGRSRPRVGRKSPGNSQITFSGDESRASARNNRVTAVPLRRFAVLEWNPRLFSLLALIALLVVALAGGWSDLFSRLLGVVARTG